MRIIRGNENTNGERAENVEEQDTPEDSADGLWDVLAWVFSFTSSDGDKLDTTVRESSVD